LEQKLKLQKMKETDFPFFSRLVYHEDVMNMNLGRPFTEEEAKGYFAYVMEYSAEHESSGGYLVFMERTPVGIAFLWIREEAEIEYMLLPEFWGKGYATEIAGMLVNRAKEEGGVRKISGTIDPANERSRRVLLENGFAFERAFEVEEDHSHAEVYSRTI